MGCVVRLCLPSRATTCKGSINVAKVQHKLPVASGLYLAWYGSMEWNMEENFSMEWKIFSMEWKWHCELWKDRFPFHSIPCPGNR